VRAVPAGSPGLGKIGAGIDLVGGVAERRQVDAVDRKAALLQRRRNGAFVGKTRLAARFRRLERRVARAFFCSALSLSQTALAIEKNTGCTMWAVSTTCSLTS
jgi:hypothetical protein